VSARAGRTLIVIADDFGLDPAYDRGILEAGAAGAIDGTGAMVLRGPRREDIDVLTELDVAVGLHLEAAAAGPPLGRDAILRQLELFERLAGGPPAFLDGHHHCHASSEVAAEVAAIAAHLDLRVRSVDAAHRGLLRDAGVSTPDLLVGRLREDEPVIPPELLEPPPSAGTIEWMVHPGYPSPGSGSSYDRGRGEDLRALLAFELPADWDRGSGGTVPARSASASPRSEASPSSVGIPSKSPTRPKNRPPS